MSIGKLNVEVPKIHAEHMHTKHAEAEYTKAFKTAEGIAERCQQQDVNNCNDVVDEMTAAANEHSQLEVFLVEAKNQSLDRDNRIDLIAQVVEQMSNMLGMCVSAAVYNKSWLV